MATVTFSPSSSSSSSAAVAPLPPQSSAFSLSSSFLRPAMVTLFFVTAATAEDL